MKNILLTTILSALALSLPAFCTFITVPAAGGDIVINTNKISHIYTNEMGTHIYVNGTALRTSLSQDKVVSLIQSCGVNFIHHFSQGK